jgi:ribosomal protein S26
LREKACFICGQKAEGWDKGNLYNVNCNKCANYTLKDLAFRQRLIRGATKALRNNERAQLSIAVKAEYEKKKRRVYLNTGKIDKLVGRPPKPIRISMT